MTRNHTLRYLHADDMSFLVGAVLALAVRGLKSFVLISDQSHCDAFVLAAFL
jgi:hypothetical protein